MRYSLPSRTASSSTQYDAGAASGKPSADPTWTTTCATSYRTCSGGLLRESSTMYSKWSLPANPGSGT